MPNSSRIGFSVCPNRSNDSIRVRDIADANAVLVAKTEVIEPACGSTRSGLGEAFDTFLILRKGHSGDVNLNTKAMIFLLWLWHCIAGVETSDLQREASMIAPFGTTGQRAP